MDRFKSIARTINATPGNGQLRLFFLNKKFSGSAIYISLITGIVICIILCLFILILNYNQRNISQSAKDIQLLLNLKSGFEIAQSDYFQDEYNDKWLCNTLSNDSIRVKRLQWGGYQAISVSTKNRYKYLSQSGIFGTFMAKDTGLIVMDNNKSIGLSGTVTFKAPVYLPRGGVKPAYIGGKYYVGTPTNNSFIKQSPSTIPRIGTGFLLEIQNQQNLLGKTDSLINHLPAVFIQPFNRNTAVYQLQSNVVEGLRIRGNIKLICSEILIDSSCHFENVLIICKKAHFKEGFKGSVHVIAKDSIVMEKNCEFIFPSSFVLLPDAGDSQALRYIKFNENCVFFGGILAFSPDNNDANKTTVFIQLNETSIINGLLYSEGLLHAEGTLNANIYASKLLLKTPSAVYENYIANCCIDPRKFSNCLYIPKCFKNKSKIYCCQKTS